MQVRYLFLMAAAAAVLNASPTSAGTPSQLKDIFLNNMGAAIAAAGECPILEVNVHVAESTLIFFHESNADIEPGGTDWPTIEKGMMSAKEAFAKMTHEQICGEAVTLLGPNGTMSRDLLKFKGIGDE